MARESLNALFQPSLHEIVSDTNCKHASVLRDARHDEKPSQLWEVEEASNFRHVTVDDPSESEDQDSRVYLTYNLNQRVSLDERKRLYRQHADLVGKKMTEGLARAELARLAFVRWQIDNIESADFAASLTSVEALVKLQEDIAAQVESLIGAMSVTRRKRSHTRKARR